MRSRSTDRPTSQRRRLPAAALAFAAVALFAAAGVTAFHTDPDPRLRRDLPAVLAVEGGPGASGDAAAAALGPRRKLPRSRQMAIPLRISIPAIGVSAAVVPLRLNRDHTLQVPTNFAQTGWFLGGPEPGEQGAAVVAGHVDSRSGPAVFYRLRALLPGDRVRLTLADRTIVRFVVTGTKAVPKRRFPTKLVYRKTARPTLRLITCDGAFDSSTGHYVDNYLVFAKLLSVWKHRSPGSRDRSPSS
jgi:sortase (surface protein transpeptidase)